jgi:hypothetical protein
MILTSKTMCHLLGYDCLQTYKSLLPFWKKQPPTPRTEDGCCSSSSSSMPSACVTVLQSGPCDEDKFVFML